MFYLSLYNQHKSHKSLKIKQKELSTVCQEYQFYFTPEIQYSS